MCTITSTRRVRGSAAVRRAFILPAALAALAWLPVEAQDAPGRIAFYSGDGASAEIYVVDPDGGRLTRLTSNDVKDECPAWSPDGARLAFVSDRDGNQEIYLMNADGSGQRRLTRTPEDEDHPDWSPDGTRLLFMSARRGNQDVYVMRDDGSGEVRLTRHPAVDMRPAWSPDGRHIVFSSNRDGNFEIYEMDADGEERPAPHRTARCGRSSRGIRPTGRASSSRRATRAGARPACT